MKKIIILFSILLITGCTKYNDLSELTIIKSIGIAYNQNYTIYAQIIDHINQDNEPIMKTIKANGHTLEIAFNNLKKNINKEVYLSHIDLLILEDNLDNINYQDIIDYLINNNEFRNDFYCVFATNVNDLLEKTKYDEIEIFLQTNTQILVKNFDDVTKEYIDNNRITLPQITYQDEIIYLGNTIYNQKENSYAKKD